MKLFSLRNIGLCLGMMVILGTSSAYANQNNKQHHGQHHGQNHGQHHGQRNAKHRGHKDCDDCHHHKPKPPVPPVPPTPCDLTCCTCPADCEAKEQIALFLTEKLYSDFEVIYEQGTLYASAAIAFTPVLPTNPFVAGALAHLATTQATAVEKLTDALTLLCARNVSAFITALVNFNAAVGEVRNAYFTVATPPTATEAAVQLAKISALNSAASTLAEAIIALSNDECCLSEATRDAIRANVATAANHIVSTILGFTVTPTTVGLTLIFGLQEETIGLLETSLDFIEDCLLRDRCCAKVARKNCEFCCKTCTTGCQTCHKENNTKTWAH